MLNLGGQFALMNAVQERFSHVFTVKNAVQECYFKLYNNCHSGIVLQWMSVKLHKKCPPKVDILNLTS